eukprot:jgi/Mesen1/6419/ME000329S05589
MRGGAAACGQMEAVVELLDAEEEAGARVAKTLEDVSEQRGSDRGRQVAARKAPYTHVEISPSFILGGLAATIPYVEHGMKAKNIGTNKQAVGVSMTSFQSRPDTTMHVLAYPQKPLVSTSAARHMGLHELPGGQNVIVAIAPMEGYTQEDAIVINQSAVDRGLFRSFVYRNHEPALHRGGRRAAPWTGAASSWRHGADAGAGAGADGGGGAEEDEGKVRFERPDPRASHPGAYEHLEADGLPCPREKLPTCPWEPRRVILMGRTGPNLERAAVDEGGGRPRKDMSLKIKASDGGSVESALLTAMESKNAWGPAAQVRVRRQCVPEVGDKFASRHGQKGVVGRLVRQEDMPWTRDGITPDLVINSYCIPVRRTVSQLLEMLAGKVQLAGDGKSVPGSADTRLHPCSCPACLAAPPLQ